jgi:hypothetical protein
MEFKKTVIDHENMKNGTTQKYEIKSWDGQNYYTLALNMFFYVNFGPKISI